MLSKCANAQCFTPFLYLHEGKLFRLEVAHSKTGQDEGNGQNGNGRRGQLPRLEYFWLCDSCAARLTVVRSNAGGVEVVPLYALRAAS